jgi:hypothetical protein
MTRAACPIAVTISTIAKASAASTAKNSLLLPLLFPLGERRERESADALRRATTKNPPQATVSPTRRNVSRKYSETWFRIRYATQGMAPPRPAKASFCPPERHFRKPCTVSATTRSSTTATITVATISVLAARAELAKPRVLQIG